MQLEEKTYKAINDNADFLMSLPRRYGDESQFSMAIEEMSELIQALEKHRRYKYNSEKLDEVLDHVAEEIADVHIMLAQLTYIFNNDEQVASYVKKKLERQRKRINNEENEKAG